MAPRKSHSRPPPSSSSTEEEEGEESEEEVQPSQPPKKPTTSTAAGPKPSPSKKPSSSLEEEDDDEEEEEYDSDSDVPPADSPKKAAPMASPPPPQQQERGREALLSDSEESGSEESESDDEPPKKPPSPPRRRSTRGPDPSIKPITSKPMDAKSPKASQKSGGDKKRKAPDTPEGNSSAAANGGTPAKNMFERIWNDDDEMVLLKAILEFKEKHDGREPKMAAGMDELLEMVKSSLHVEFAKAQIATKIRHLKRRYRSILARPRILSKPHEKVSFNLSNKIWGDGPKAKAELVEDREHTDNDAMEENVAKRNRRKERNRRKDKSVCVTASARKPNRGGAVATVPVSVLSEAQDVSVGVRDMYPVLFGAVEDVERFNTNMALHGLLRSAVGSLKPEIANALEAKWKKQCLAELKMHGKRMEMLSELLKLLGDSVLEGSK